MDKITTDYENEKTSCKSKRLKKYYARQKVKKKTFVQGKKIFNNHNSLSHSTKSKALCDNVRRHGYAKGAQNQIAITQEAYNTCSQSML